MIYLHKQHVFIFYNLSRSIVCYLIANTGFHTKTGVTFNFISCPMKRMVGNQPKINKIVFCIFLLPDNIIYTD